MKGESRRLGFRTRLAASVVACSVIPLVARADRAPSPGVEVAPASPPPLFAALPESTERPRDGARDRVPSIVLGSFAVAGATAGAVFGALALENQSRFDRHPTFSAADAANEDAVIADVCFGAAVVLAVTAVVLLLERKEPPAVGAVPSPGSAATARSADAVPSPMPPTVSLSGGGAGAVLRF